MDFGGGVAVDVAVPQNQTINVPIEFQNQGHETLEMTDLPGRSPSTIGVASAIRHATSIRFARNWPIKYRNFGFPPGPR